MSKWAETDWDLSNDDLALITGIGLEGVRSARKRYGRPPTHRPPYKTLATGRKKATPHSILASHEDWSMSYAEIAQIYGVTRQAVSAFVRYHNLHPKRSQP